MKLVDAFSFRRRPAPRAHGFSLVELLVVLAIIAILAAVSIPSISSILQNGSLNQAGQQLDDQIGLARQLASAHNATMELRLFQLPGAPAAGYSEMQIWQATTNSSGASVMQPASKTSILPQSVIISANTTLSSALNGNTPLTMPANSGPLSGATYVAFEFRPSGVVTPVLNMNAYALTILATRYATNTTLPVNYVIVQINPVTSTPIIYRP